MAQPEYNFTYALNGTSTGNVSISTGSRMLHTVTVNTLSTSATNSIGIYNGTSSAAAQIASVTLSGTQTFLFDVVAQNGLFLGNTSATGDVTVTWA